MRKFLANLSSLWKRNPAPEPVAEPEPVPVAKKVTPRTSGKVKTKSKKKLLPKNFDELLKAGDIGQLKAVFETCDIDAHDGYSKRTALAFYGCPEELVRWLLTQGADMALPDRYGRTPVHIHAGMRTGHLDILLEAGADANLTGENKETPLHAAAMSHQWRNAKLLVARGAAVDALNREGLTPLELALQRCANSDIENMVTLAEYLLEVGARQTPRMKGLVAEIGKRFEFHRGGFNPEKVEAASAALDRLYIIFDVPPVPHRTIHDGQAPIVVRATSWPEQHEELWQLLVPSSGAAATMQGEVIRISGRISHELEGNGGGNWDKDYNQMADAFIGIIQNGNGLPNDIVSEARSIAQEIKRSRTGDSDRLVEWAVQWVLLNPNPIALPKPSYKR